MRVKICGITNLSDALYSAQVGAWAIGFNFYRNSPRFIGKESAKAIIKKCPSTLKKVGIFIEESFEEIQEIMNEIGLDLAQIYKDAPYHQSLKSKMIYCLQPDSIETIPYSIIKQYHSILIDAPRTSQELYGGTGLKARWDIAAHLAKEHCLILAGGLDPQNVREAISSVQPDMVDVASGVERFPGVKDKKLIKKFILEAHDAK